MARNPCTHRNRRARPRSFSVHSHKGSVPHARVPGQGIPARISVVESPWYRDPDGIPGAYKIAPDDRVAPVRRRAFGTFGPCAGGAVGLTVCS